MYILRKCKLMYAHYIFLAMHSLDIFQIFPNRNTEAALYIFSVAFLKLTCTNQISKTVKIKHFAYKKIFEIL